MDSSGLVLYTQGRYRWWLLYGWKHGFGYGWLPGRIQSAIVAVWNPMICFFKGHDRTIEELRDELPDDASIECTMCCTLLTEANRETLFQMVRRHLNGL